MYQVLYRKYRPKVFADVYGQDHVTSTLKNEIKEGRISHAYLFTGSRGTGKTTCAKIFARAVNCERSEDGEPCNECEVCRGLEKGTIYDVVEIDAASNNGVDNIRELREEAGYTPARGKYRVYIIDEVHMLSQGAFNALLKTLEEPPEHVIFILATTEVHKIPATILSRCQRFDFKRIQPQTMALRLKEVAELEGLTLDDSAAVLIARIADGALRDGLSILDQCSSRSSDINSSLVAEVVGIAGREALYRLSKFISEQNSAGAVEEVSSLYQNSFDMERLCVEMINHFRNFLIVKAVKNNRSLIICTDDEYNMICENAADFTLESVTNALELFQNTLVKIKSGAAARMEMEMAFVRLCEPKLEGSLDSLLDRLSKVERRLSQGVKPPTATVSSTAEAVKEEKVADAPSDITHNSVTVENPKSAYEKHTQPTEPLTSNERETASDKPSAEPTQSKEPASANVQVEFDAWEEFMELIHKSNAPLHGVLINARGYVRGDYFLIQSANPSVSEFVKVPTAAKSIKSALFEITGKNYKLGILKNNGDTAPKQDKLEDLINRAQNNIKINFE